MISNFNYCCTRCPNGGFYVEVRNKVLFFVYFLIGYKIKDKFSTKQTPVFGPGKRERLLFPSEVENLNIKVFNAANIPPTLIMSTNILSNESACYEVVGNVILPDCIRIPC